MSAVSDWIGARWNEMKEGFQGISRNTFSLQSMMDVMNIATSDPSWDQKSTASKVGSALFKFGQMDAANVGQMASPVLKLPVVKQVGEAANWLSKNVVNRPVATAGLAADAADKGEGSFFSGDTWSTAWNQSKDVSAGQAISYNAGQAFGYIDGSDPSYDPRVSKEHYFNDPFFIATSGGIDFMLSLVDPLKGASKLVRIGKASYIDRVVSPEKVAKGALEQQTFGKQAEYGQSFEDAGGGLAPRTEKLYQHAQNMPASTFQKTFFNNFAQGPIVASGLHIAARQGDRGMFSDILMAARGNAPAYQRVVERSAAGTNFAEAMGQMRNVYNVANVHVRRGDDPFSRTIADAQTADHAEAWTRQIAEVGANDSTPLFWSDVRDSMAGRGTPRRTLGSMFSTGVQMATDAGYLPRTVTRWADPSKGYAAHLEVNLSASASTFRSNLERAGDYMSDDVRNRYVAAYMAAPTANERSRIAAMADNYVISTVASRYGLARKDIDRIVQETSFRRQTFRQMLNASERYMPAEFLKQAEKVAKAGDKAESDKLTELATKYQQAIRNGELPNTVQFMSDDRGRLVAVMGRVEKDNPLLTSQAADYLPMTDYRRLDRQMRSYVHPRSIVEKANENESLIAAGLPPKWDIPAKELRRARRKSAVGLTTGTVDDFYRAINKVWSVAAVLRPGQTLRTLADDGMRAVSLMGILPMLTSGSQGVYRVPYNLTRRGMTLLQERSRTRALRALDGGNPAVDVAELGQPTTLSDEASESAGAYQQRDPLTDILPKQLGDTTVYDSLEAAVVNGYIPLDTYVDHVWWASRQGRVPVEVAALLEERLLGLRQNRSFRTELINYVMNVAGRDAYANPRWQVDFADAVNELGFDDPRGVIANPLTDEARTYPDKNIHDEYQVGTTKTLYTNPLPGETFGTFDDYDGIHDFVITNIEDFIGGAKLHAKQLPDSRVRLSVLKPRNAPPVAAERMSKREKNDLAIGLRMRGATGVTLRYKGRTVEIPGSFAGTDGDFARSAVSSRPNDMPWQVLLSMRAGDRVVAKSNRVSARDLTPADGKDYAEGWERSVNAQLANDAVARQFLEGKSVGHVLDWVESTPEGQRWLNDRGQRSMNYDEQVGAIHGLVDYLVPESAGQQLRTKVLAQEASIHDLRAAIPDDSRLPNVNGHVTEVNLGTHPAIRWVQKKLDSWFKWMQDKPADTLVRYPFFDESYKRHISPMVKTYMAQLPEGAVVRKAEVDRMARMARQQAIYDTRQYLYDQTFRTDAASVLSAVMPFSQAVADSTFKWLKIARERPLDVVANFGLLYNAPARAGLIYDQDGNHLTLTADGKEEWRAAVTGEVIDTPMEHERFVAFAAPSTVRNHLVGRGAIEPAVFSQSSLSNAVFDPSVNVGPVIALPVNHFALKDPEIAEDKFVKQFVLPFGPTNDSAQMMLPGMLRSARQWFKEDSSKASSQTMTIYQQMLTEYGTGKRSTMPTIQEAQQLAASERALRFFTSAIQPASFQQVNPYKPFTDYYNNLLRKHDYDEDKAMTEFRNNGMYDDFIYQTARVTKTNIAIPSTIQGYKEYMAKKDAIQKFPDLAGLIVGRDGAGQFSKAVYEWEKDQKYDETGNTIRQEMGISESIDDVKKRLGWNDYQKFMAMVHNDLEGRGLTSIRDRGAEDLLNNYQTWINSKVYDVGPNGEVQLSPWYTDFRDTDETYMQKRLAEMQQLLMGNQKWVTSRDDFQGLAQYLQLRQKVQTAMDIYGYKTLDSQKADWLQRYWQAQVYDMKSTNLSFGQLYDRWLTRDNLGADGLAANEILSVLEGGGVNG